MEKFFVSRPIFAMVISIIIVLLGVISIGRLPVEQYPDITPPVVSVSANYQGADAKVVNDAVVTPIAQSIMGVSDMLYMQTTAANDGSATVQVIFDIDSDPDMDEIFTQNNVSSATALLPQAVVQQGVTTQKLQTGFILVYALHSDGRYDSNFLSNYAYINIKDELLRINGVGNVQIMGAGEYSMRIWIKPEMLDYYDMSVEEIIAAVESQADVFPAGKLGAQPLDEPSVFTYTVTTDAQINTAEEYENIIIRADNEGGQVRLKDVATVDLGSQSYGVLSDFDGTPGALMIVYQTPGSNAMQVGAQVKAKMEELSERFIDGVEYATIVDATTTIGEGIREIVKTLIFALLLVIVIIYLFLQDVRATIIPLVAIPVSLVGAFMLFPLFGFSINIISLLGLVLAIGLVVDDAIVVVEAVQVNMERGMMPRQATLAAMKNVASPIIATTVVLLAVFIPVSFTGGVPGKLFQQFSVGIAVSVVISAFNALTLSPALCAMILRPHKKSEKGFFGLFNRWFDRRMQNYMTFSKVVVRHTVRVVILVVAALVGIWGGFKLLPDGFLPTEDQGYLMVTVQLPEAAGVTRTQAAMDKARTVIGQVSGVQTQSSASGFDMISNIAATNDGIIFVTLKPFKERKQTAAQIATEINERLYAAVPEAQFYAFEPPSIPGLGVVSGVTFVLQDRGGSEIGYLAEQGDKFLSKAEKLPELASVTTQFNAGVPQRKLIVNRDLAMQEGVSLTELHNLVSTFLGGTYINNFNRFGKLYDTYIQAQAQYRDNESDLNGYYIKNGSGESLPLSSFVSIKDTVGVEYISQFDLYNAIAYTATPAKGVSTAQAMTALQKLVDTEMPDDITLAWNGVSFQESNSSSNTVYTYLLALLFVFLALAALYESWSLPFSILLGVPFAVFGALLFVWLAHLLDPAYADNVFMVISLVMLIGLAAKNAILVVEYADKMFFEENKSLEESALGAAALRVRPILMTAFAFIIGVLPLVFASGAFSTARKIIGMALVGGMGVATILGIFLYPALYYLVGRLANFDRLREIRRARGEKL